MRPLRFRVSGIPVRVEPAFLLFSFLFGFGLAVQIAAYAPVRRNKYGDGGSTGSRMRVRGTT